MNDILEIDLLNRINNQTFKPKLKEKAMKNYLKILILLTILITITYKILFASDTEIDSKSNINEGNKNIPGSFKIKSEETGYIGISKLTTTSFGMYNNSCSILQ